MGESIMSNSRTAKSKRKLQATETITRKRTRKGTKNDAFETETVDNVKRWDLPTVSKTLTEKRTEQSQVIREAGLAQDPKHYNGPAVAYRPDLPRYDPVDQKSPEIASNGQEQVGLQALAVHEHVDPQEVATEIAASGYAIDFDTPNLPRDSKLRSEPNSKIFKEFVFFLVSKICAWLQKMLQNCSPNTIMSILVVISVLCIAMWSGQGASPDTHNVFETAESYLDRTTHVANSIGAAAKTMPNMHSTQSFVELAATVQKSANFAKQTLKSARQTYNGLCPAHYDVKAAATSCKCLTQKDEAKVLEQKNKVLQKEKEIHEQLENAGIATNKLEVLTNQARSAEKKAKNAMQQNAAERNEMTSGYAAIRRQKKEHAAKQDKKAAEAKTATKANMHLY